MDSRCGGFSCCRAQAPGHVGSEAVAGGLNSAVPRLSSTGSIVVAHRLSCFACSMWDLPGPGFEPVCPALAGRFSTTEPPGRPKARVFHEDQRLLIF